MKGGRFKGVDEKKGKEAKEGTTRRGCQQVHIGCLYQQGELNMRK
jgi:hypothetical protein